MSYTELFKFNKKGDAEPLGETRNAFRGAMAVWRYMEEKYLPVYSPYGMIMSRMNALHDESAAQDVWDCWKNPEVPVSEKIVMLSTFDNVIVDRERIPELIEAFELFPAECSLKEQAAILRKALEDEDIIAVAWNQTSVNGNTWTNKGGYDEEENPIPYNVLKMSDHWELFHCLEEWKRKQTHCLCPADIKTGWIEENGIQCCNICGKPQKSIFE